MLVKGTFIYKSYKTETALIYWAVDKERNVLIKKYNTLFTQNKNSFLATPLQSFAEERRPIDQQNKLPDSVLTTSEKDNTPVQAESEPLLFEMQEQNTETSQFNVLPATKGEEHNSDRNTAYTDDLIEEKPSIDMSTIIEIHTPDSCGPSDKDAFVKSSGSDYVTEMIIENKSDIFEHAKKKKKKMTSKGLVECGIWDFAGQKDYYVTHQTFFTPNAIYIVVADIENEIKPINHNENVEFDSIGDYIDFWFDSIHCFCEEGSEMHYVHLL
ncbi:unnamed protein product [Mytilus edulis]|uniref:Uncharacterized protein n=1 Tax=Mytilus edulis TaxID=6550 RepID=A0A8S3VIL0_MYTED|nr:unnamed protein product [Mytilus edulis]